MIYSGNLHELVADIESSNVQIVNRPLIANGIELIPYENLITELSGHFGALLVRSIMFQLSIDENRVLKWRIENKYLQYQLFNYYSPGCMPETFGLSEVLSQKKGVQKARELFSNGFFLKATLGDASFATRTWDKTNEFDDLIIDQSSNNDQLETYTIQKKLKLLREFRVHTFGREIIPLLTYRIPNTQYFNYHYEAEQFVSAILNSLPDQILQGTLIGWDIGWTNSGNYYIIEANFTGFHPEYRKGFQTTGYVDNPQYGTMISAWLNKYFEANFGIYIDSIHPALLLNNPFYKAFEFYTTIFNNPSFDVLVDKQRERPISIILYLGQVTNVPILNLLNHFLNVDLAEKYYVIVNHDNFPTVSSLYKMLHVKIIDETSLFTVQQYQPLIHMGYNRKKQISCYHVARKLNNETYLII